MEIDEITGEVIGSPEQAFIGAKVGYEFDGIPLRPYSASRKVAAQSLGLLYPYIGDAGAELVEKTGVYPGALLDTIIVLWLCSLPDPQDLTIAEHRDGAWTPARAMSRQDAAKEEMMAWADRHGILDVQCEKFLGAYQIFIAILSGVSASEFQLKVDGVKQGPQEDESPNV